LPGPRGNLELAQAAADLIDEKRIPDDVAIQVLCQCREDLITRTVESLHGAKNVIFHLYNSTSPAQRRGPSVPRSRSAIAPSRPGASAGRDRPAPRARGGA